jgi:hypothetical protein
MSEDNEFNDEFAGIFDNLKPEDFHPFKGRIAFDEFVTQNIEITRRSWLAADGHINPLAVLATAAEQWTYAPTDDETLGEYVDRLRAEAKRLGATWLYLSRKTLVGNYKASQGEQIPDASDPEAVQAAIESGMLMEGVFYYAERHEEDSEPDYRLGVMKPEEENRLGAPVEGNPHHQSATFFKGILG